MFVLAKVKFKKYLWCWRIVYVVEQFMRYSLTSFILQTTNRLKRFIYFMSTRKGSYLKEIKYIIHIRNINFSKIIEKMENILKAIS